MFTQIIKGILNDVRVITFDLDLTISYMNDAVDRADALFFKYVNDNYSELGISYQDEIRDVLYERLINNGGKCKNIGDLRRDVISSYVKKSRYPIEIVDELFNTTLIPFSNELLHLLNSHGYILAVITNGTADLSCHPELEGILKAFVNSDTCGESKPSPIPFEKVVEIVGIYDSSLYMHVGDDFCTDVIGASNAGWKSVWISGDSTKLPQTDVVPDITVKSMEDLYSVCKQALDGV